MNPHESVDLNFGPTREYSGSFKALIPGSHFQSLHAVAKTQDGQKKKKNLVKEKLLFLKKG